MNLNVLAPRRCGGDSPRFGMGTYHPLVARRPGRVVRVALDRGGCVGRGEFRAVAWSISRVRAFGARHCSLSVRSGSKARLQSVYMDAGDENCPACRFIIALCLRRNE